MIGRLYAKLSINQSITCPTNNQSMPAAKRISMDRSICSIPPRDKHDRWRSAYFCLLSEKFPRNNDPEGEESNKGGRSDYGYHLEVPPIRISLRLTDICYITFTGM